MREKDASQVGSKPYACLGERAGRLQAAAARVDQMWARDRIAVELPYFIRMAMDERAALRAALTNIANNGCVEDDQPDQWVECGACHPCLARIALDNAETTPSPPVKPSVKETL